MVRKNTFDEEYIPYINRIFTVKINKNRKYIEILFQSIFPQLGALIRSYAESFRITK